MPEMTPDFRNRTPAIDPMAIANVLQRKAQIEEQRRQYEQDRKDKQISGLMDAVVTGQKIASNMMTMAEQRTQMEREKKQAAAVQDVQNITQEPDMPQNLPEPSLNPQDNQQVVQNYQQDQKKRLMAALIGAEPKEVIDNITKQQFAKPLSPTYETKDGLLDGKPIRYVVNAREGIPRDMTAAHNIINGDIQPYNMNTQTELTDADRKRLAPLADAAAAGKAQISALVNARGNEKEKLALVTAERHPDFDLTMANQRIATRKEFSQAGPTGKALVSLSTVVGHMDTLEKKIDALDNKAIPKYNSIANYLQKNVGKPEVSGFIAAKGLVISEMGKIAQGSGIVTNEERQEFSKALDTASSPAQAREVIQTWMDLIKSRSDSIKSSWNQTMGDQEPPVPFLSEKAKSTLIKHGYNPKTLEKTSSAKEMDNSSLDALANVLGLKKRK